MNPLTQRTHTLSRITAGGLLVLALPAVTRGQLPPDYVSQVRSLNNSRVEAATILGGDFGLSAGHFDAQDNTIDVSKFGGAGDVGDPRPLAALPISWQPRLQGSMGWLNSELHGSDQLQGTKNEYDTFAIQFGGGARFWFGDHLSAAPTLMGMYGYTENSFHAGQNAFAQTNHAWASDMGLVDWHADTWTLRPAMNLQYTYTFRRTTFTLSSDFNYFHTESFDTSNSHLDIDGDSETWQNKLDVDIPIGCQLFGRELHTGGYFSRTELYDGIEQGLSNDHIYEIHGRLVLDYLNKLWKFQWIGIGCSYMWGSDFDGYSVGADIAFKF